MTSEVNGHVLGSDIERGLERDDLIVITGAGGFIAGSLARYFHDLGYTRIRAVDRKPLPEWYQRVPGVECLSMDLSHEANAIRAAEGAVEVYNLAADMGGMGFIENFRVECLRSVLVNTNMIEASYRAGSRPLPAPTTRISRRARTPWRSRSRTPTRRWPSGAMGGRS